MPDSVETPVADRSTDTLGQPVADDITLVPPVGVPEQGDAQLIDKSKPTPVCELSE